MPVNPELQEQGRRVWGAGNWDEVADYVRQVGEPLLDAIGLEPGMRLLDVGAGSGGSIAIPAALRGAEVVASDLVGEHFEAGRRRAGEAGVEIEWVEADALDLPFDDESFDRVTSTFGHMFAPDHALAAAEMERVCKPGGVIGFACWTPEGLIGQMFATTGSFMPPPPEGFQPPPLWGTEAHVRELLEPLGLELSFERKLNVFKHESFDEYNEHFESNFGPMVSAKAVLGDRFAELTEATHELFRQANKATGGGIETEGEYLQTVARKPQ
jgi:ubiquinone/menaquinone biosynthesis C-methylase UbiE